MERPRTSFNVRTLVVGAVAAAELVSISPAEAAPADIAPEAPRPQDKSPHKWDKVWEETFDGTTLSDRWEPKDNTSYQWDTFEDYRTFNQRVLKGNLEIIARAHCVAEGEDMTLANAQVDPCTEPGDVRMYSTGRVEQVVIPDLGYNYRIDVVAKMPVPEIEGQVAQMSAWTTNVDETPGSGNEGFCDANSETPTAEIDLIESHGDGVVRANHHVYCKNGDLPDVPRSEQFTPKELSKYHTYSVEHIRNRTRLLFDGATIKLSKKYGKRYADKPKDFIGTSYRQYMATKKYPHHLIFDGTVFKDLFAKNPAFRAPNPNLPYATQIMKVSEVVVSKLRQRQ